MSENSPFPDESDLPNEWSLLPLDELCTDIRTGGTPDTDNEDFWTQNKGESVVPWRTSKNLLEDRDGLERESKYVTEEGLSQTTVAESGDVALGCRVNVGRVSPVDDESAFSQDVKVLRLGDKIDNNYLSKYLLSLKNYYQKLQRGATITGITNKHVRSVMVPVPPLDEQGRIVEAVEERLERVERLETSVENVGRLADEYQDSYLAHVLSGVDVNLEDTIVEGLPSSEDDVEYDIVELGKVVDYHSNLMNPQDEPDKEYNLIELNDVEKDAGGITNIQNKKGKDIGSNKREFNDKHVLYCKLRPYLNKVVRPSFSGIASSELLVLEPTDKITRDYLYFYLSSPMVRDKAEFLMRGANQPRLSKKDLMSFNIPVPPIQKQKEIVENVKKIKSGKLKTSVNDVSGLFKEYRSSVLSHAFQGDIDY